MSIPYKPVSCSLYDWLEASAVRNLPVEVLFNGLRKSLFVKDLRTLDQVEYLVALDADSGEDLVIRLDQIKPLLSVSSTF